MKYLSNSDFQENNLINVPTPVNDRDVANKEYVDSSIDSLDSGVVFSDEPPSDTGVLWVDTDDTSVPDFLLERNVATGVIPANAAGIQTVTLGFRPGLIMFDSTINSSNASMTYAQGDWNTTTGAQSSTTSTVRLSPSPLAASRNYDDKCLSMISISSGGDIQTFLEAVGVDLTTTGFRINITVPASNATLRYKAIS